MLCSVRCPHESLSVDWIAAIHILTTEGQMRILPFRKYITAEEPGSLAGVQEA